MHRVDESVTCDFSKWKEVLVSYITIESFDKSFSKVAWYGEVLYLCMLQYVFRYNSFCERFFVYSNYFSSECTTGVDCIPKRHNYH